jgi:hypothetical protein
LGLLLPVLVLNVIALCSPIVLLIAGFVLTFCLYWFPLPWHGCAYWYHLVQLCAAVEYVVITEHSVACCDSFGFDYDMRVCHTLK